VRQLNVKYVRAAACTLKWAQAVCSPDQTASSNHGQNLAAAYPYDRPMETWQPFGHLIACCS
jgi:hypothetical protein